jgi:rhomboid protease GluP
MDANLLLLFLVAAAAIFALWRGLFMVQMKHNFDWIFISIGGLVLATLGWFIVPGAVGFVAGLYWLLLVLVPSYAQRAALSFELQRRYQAASWAAKIARFLHPFGQLRFLPDMIEAGSLIHKGRYDDAGQALKRLSGHSATQFFALSTQYWLDGDHNGMLDWLQRRYSADAFRRDPNAVMRYIFALGATGNLDKMVVEFEFYRTTLEESPQHLNYALLYVFSVCGCLQQVEQLFVESIRLAAPELKQQWIAVTRMAAGQVEQASSELSRLLLVKDGLVSRSAYNILARPIVPAETQLSGDSKMLLSKIITRNQADQTYRRDHLRGKVRRSYITIGLALVILAVYLLELEQGGDTDVETLYRLGALWPADVIEQGKWWPLIAFMFLHYGILHIGLNLLALLIIGPFIESMLGRVRFMVVYFFTGIGSAYAAVLLTRFNWLPPNVYVGASGAIMGLFGAAAAIYFLAWRAHRSVIALSFLRRVALAIGLQVVADIIIPGTSLSIHLIGAILGFLATMTLHYVLLAKAQMAVT